MKIKTVKLQEMLVKVIKGAGNNKLIPLTSMLRITVDNGLLELTTTDGTNYLIVRTMSDIDDNLYAVVNAEQFSKLVSKLNTEFVELEVSNKTLHISTESGSYTMDLQFDESGDVVKFPNIVIEGDMYSSLKASSIQSLSNICKASLATTLEVPVYTGYYLSGRAVATDGYKITELSIPFFDKPVLLSSTLVDLLTLFTDEEIKVALDSKSGRIMFSSDNMVIKGMLMPDIEEFRIDAISPLLNQSYDGGCKVNKTDLLAALDRISLFIGMYDDSAIRLLFTEDGLIVESKTSTGVEKVDYAESRETLQYSCLINAYMLIDQVKCYPEEVISIGYGLDNAIQLKGSNSIQVIALLEDRAL